MLLTLLRLRTRLAGQGVSRSDPSNEAVPQRSALLVKSRLFGTDSLQPAFPTRRARPLVLRPRGTASAAPVLPPPHYISCPDRVLSRNVNVRLKHDVCGAEVET